jgi:acylphosphatase
MAVTDIKRVEPRRGRLFVISGRVQGVGYRVFAVTTAERLGITGWARNLEDGRVEVHAEGGRAPMEEFEQYLRKGPQFADVTGVEATEVAASQARDFTIRV